MIYRRHHYGHAAADLLAVGKPSQAELGSEAMHAGSLEFPGARYERFEHEPVIVEPALDGMEVDDGRLQLELVGPLLPAIPGGRVSLVARVVRPVAVFRAMDLEP